MSKCFRYVASAFLLLYLISLYHRVIHIDDPALGELAYWVSKLGHARSTLWAGINGYEVIDLNYHKMIVALGALVIKIFGLSVYKLKAISLVFFLFFLWGYKKYFAGRRDYYSEQDFYWTALLLWSTSLVFYYSFVYRPEIPVMALGFWGFYFLRRSVLDSGYNRFWLTGLLFGLSMAFHLKGVSYVLAGGAFILIYHRKFVALLQYGFCAAAGASLYFWDVTTLERLAIFKKQFFNNPVMVGNPGKFWWHLLKPLEEHKRFFHQEHEIAFSLLFFACLIFYFKPLRQVLRHEITFFFLTVLALGFTTNDITDKSLLMHYPFMVLIIFTSFKIARGSLPVLIKVLAALFVVVNMGMNIRTVLHMQDVPSRSKIAAAQIKNKSARVMADISFIFNEIENFEIYANSNYTSISAFYTGEKRTLDKYFEFVERFKIDNIVFDNASTQGEVEELFRDVDLSMGKDLRNFKVIFNSDGIIVLERQGS